MCFALTGEHVSLYINATDFATSKLAPAALAQADRCATGQSKVNYWPLPGCGYFGANK